MNRFPTGNAGKLTAMNIKVHYQFFAVRAPCIFISHIFWLKPLKPVFATQRACSL
jgi:hypothetical protein